MHLSEKEIDRALVFLVAEMARRRRAKGLKLNYPESMALITDEAMEAAREGLSYDEVVKKGCRLLTEREVMEGVKHLASVIQFEAQFEDGTRLVTLTHPIRPSGARRRTQAPGAIVSGEKHPSPCEGRGRQIRLRNTGTRPVWITSHADLALINPAIRMTPRPSSGQRLDLPPGDLLEISPGMDKEADTLPGRVQKRAGRRTSKRK